MYTRQEASRLRQKFWTSFGQYMKPILNAEGSSTNWVNYHTGLRHLYFRMDADHKMASLAIELHHPDEQVRMDYFEQFRQLKTILEEMTGDGWEWIAQKTNERGNTISVIRKLLPGANIFNETDWPAIISFFKPGIVSLDEFWLLVKERFQ